MSNTETDWRLQGFASTPHRRVCAETGLLLYRCWGSRSRVVGSTEWGSGYFSIEKPSSVLEAELRFNVVDWSNGVNFVSTFRLKPGFEYLVGSVANGASDLSLPGMQVFVEAPLGVKLELIRSAEILRHDVVVASADGHA